MAASSAAPWSGVGRVALMGAVETGVELGAGGTVAGGGGTVAVAEAVGAGVIGVGVGSAGEASAVGEARRGALVCGMGVSALAQLTRQSKQKTRIGNGFRILK